MNKRHWVRITSESVVVDGIQLQTSATGAGLLTELYRLKVNDYSKFFKMDELSKLGFVASELLLQAAGDRHSDSEDRAVILFNRSGSLCNDRKYQETIQQVDDFFPSPALFVYTLPNIVTGEIAIRNTYYGETSFYVLAEKDDKVISEVIEASFRDTMTQSVIGGWLDCEDKDHFDAEIYLIEK
jgi:3-oxoacyl-[acyl-carrier-protein] synthase-1